MSQTTDISWADSTFNPWIGCTKVSPGCANCYADAQDKFRKWTPEGWGKGKPRRLTSDSNWREPVKWNNTTAYDCPACGQTHIIPTDPMKGVECDCTGTICIPRSPRVFCASLADWLDDEVPVEWLARLLKLIFETPHLDWLLLTKRPQNWSRRMVRAMKWNEDNGGDAVLHAWILDWVTSKSIGEPPANVWIGTTVEDQERADERIPQLLQIPAKVRFLSCEPLLERVWLPDNLFNAFTECPIHWVITGGESGQKARPLHPDWARSLRDQCVAAGVPFFFKQWGEWILVASIPRREELVLSVTGSIVHGTPRVTDTIVYRVGKKAAGRLLDGVEHNAFPEVAK